MSNEIIRHFKILWYTVVATVESYRVNFVIFKIDTIGLDGVGEGGVRWAHLLNG